MGKTVVHRPCSSIYPYTRLKRLEERMIISRNDPLYISKMFKSRWQPLPAYIGMIGCVFVVIWSGIPALYILGAKNSLTSTDLLKSSVSLACDVLGAYSGVSSVPSV